MQKLFTPITFKNVELKNRLMMSPMCMYSCLNEDGKVTPFHHTHLVSRAVGQVGLIMMEATAVLPEGRISPRDVGIWDDAHVDGLKEINEQIHQYDAKAGIQLAHAGQKAELTSDIYAPSAIRFDDNLQVPNEMTEDDIKRTIQAFGEGAKRAKAANFDVIEIHAAHGYLINEFLSPLTNQRTDRYGGSVENRYQFLSDVIQAVQAEWEGPIFVRISTNEYHESGNTMQDILYITQQMKKQGVDLIDCSTGGVVPVKVSAYPGYQVPRCETIKQETDISTAAVGLITSGIQADEIIQNERADIVAIGRALLKNPYWAKQAADELNYAIEAPTQYGRGWQ